ncbi:MAG TPA: dTDP-4-dehydrorhamnose 3,5-epimerase family protein [Vitreimonas sp.]|nr:dTDP-4-dehydrorhamnose 3,5-epimerase family protein [Vitreimonas sp.]
MTDTSRLPASTLPGVRYGRVARHADQRGAMREIWRASEAADLDPIDTGSPPGSRPAYVQANLSTSRAGVLRGLHFHRRQLDRWLVASGRAWVALVDVRPVLSASSPPKVETRELLADQWVVIPAGVAHGFLALEALDLVYFVTNEYDGTDELGFAWDDPIAAVGWPALEVTPDGRPILSERDRSNPSLTELVDRLRTV